MKVLTDFVLLLHTHTIHTLFHACLSVCLSEGRLQYLACVCELCGGIQINRCHVRGKRIYPFAFAVLRSSSCIAISCFRPPLG